MDDCIFCQIRDGKSPSNTVFENDHVLGFTTIAPVSKGHILVVPKKHFENILGVNDDKILREIGSAIGKLSKKVVSENNATGVNILNASGKDAQQTISHLHFHIVPRYPNDGLDMWIKQSL
jgi:histidine triad (HIT) family protein